MEVTKRENKMPVDPKLKIESFLKNKPVDPVMEIGTRNSHGIQVQLIAEKDGEMRIIPMTFVGEYEKSYCENPECALNPPNSEIEVFLSANPPIMAFSTEITEETFKTGRLIGKRAGGINEGR